MIAMAIVLFFLAAVLIAAGILIILKPIIGWYSKQWMFKEDISEPSDTFISTRKFMGVFAVCVGLLFLAGGVLNCL